MRILHFSDIHLPLRLRSVPLKDWLGKRMIGGANLLIGRAGRFADGPKKIAALARFRRQIAADLVICTGDYTALGTLAGLRKARQTVQPLMEVKDWVQIGSLAVGAPALPVRPSPAVELSGLWQETSLQVWVPGS